MSVVVSGTLKNPDGAVVSGANITLTALTVSPDALSGTSASAVTTASGYYGMTMEPGEYAVSVSVKGKTSVYGRIRIEGTESSVTLNMLLRRSLVEVSIPDELLVGFRQIQNNVADDLATIRRLNEDSAEKNRQSIQAKDIAVESARHAEESETRIRELALQAQASEHEAGRQAGIAIAAADTSGENARRAEHAMAATEGIAADTANEVARRISQEVKDNARRAEDGATNAEHYASVSKAGAERSETSKRKTAELADNVSVSLQQTLAATHDAQEARDIAIQKAGEVAAGMADVQENALKISQSLQEVTLVRDAAVRAREGAESALAATVQQVGIATQQAEEAGNAVKQATRQAELTATARNEAVSARDETAAFAREVSESVTQINQKVTAATDAAERAENAAGTTTRNAEQAASSADKAAKDREATQTLTQRAETAAGRAEEIAGAFNLEDASLEKKGIVRLSSATYSDSETEAATPKAVKKAIEMAGQKYTAQDATTTQKGVVQLSNATDSDSETEAATSKAVKEAYDLAKSRASSEHSHSWEQITNVAGASLTEKGVVQLSSATDSDSETEAATPKAVKTAYDLANGKYTAQDGTTTRKGLVQLSSATSSNSETEAATPKAVKAVMDETNRKAPLDSPALTGTPTAPTAEQSVNNTQIATTAFVKAAIAAMVASAPAALDTLNELARALGNDPQFATTMLNALAGKQPLDEQLTAFSQLDATQNTFPYFDSNNQLSLANISEAARTLLALTTKEAMQEHLGGSTGEKVTLQTDIYDRTEGVAAIPGMFGYGSEFSLQQPGQYPYGEVLLDSPWYREQLSAWIYELRPGRHYVSVDGLLPADIYPPKNFTGVIEIIDSGRVRHVLCADANGKGIFYFICANNIVAGHRKLNISVADLIAALYSTDGSEYNKPALGGVILARYENGSDSATLRGMIYQGSKLKAVTLSVSVGSGAINFVEPDSSVYGSLPGTYRALTGTGLAIQGGSVIDLFIRVG